MKESSNIELFLKNNENALAKMRSSKRNRWLILLNKRARKLYSEGRKQTDRKIKNEMYAQALNAIEHSLFHRAKTRFKCILEDTRVSFHQRGKKKVIDNTGKGIRDYFSIVLITKNSARYIREYILFYQVTGADRIYLYDNDSTDNLMEEIQPFLESGFVIYRRWSGEGAVQTAAYRDAVRRTKKRTKWLAIVDDDEFLFSPKGPMPEQLRNYEDYPGVGANWVMFGPNGHEESPTGFVMDNYTTTFAETNCVGNCHVKSIVQPVQVSCIYHTHFAVYKHGRYAVDERKGIIDNFNAYSYMAGQAFTPENYREVFRINHYCTKSLEDLRRKCDRGYADGAPNAVFENQVSMFDAPMVEDTTIATYAKIVRERLNQLES